VKTYSELRAEIIAQCFPSGQAENLVDAHNQIFQEGAAEIAKWVKCEQDRNVNVVEFCKTNYKCGMTVVRAPRGIIKRVYTLANKQWCDPVFLRQTLWPVPEDWARNLFVSPAASGLPQRLPFGFAYADATNDSLCGRARAGVWCVHDGNIYIAPWIQSNEVVVIEWEGIKAEWTDDDPVNDAQDYKKALKMYYQHGHERDYGDAADARRYKMGDPPGTGGFDQALADLMWQCNEETKLRPTHESGIERNRWFSEIADDVPATMLTIAHIGNYGSGDTNAQQVAALLRGFPPSAIITSGNNSGSGDYDLDVGQFYHDFLKGYAGAFGSGSDTNYFWPSPGSVDWADAALVPYQDFFTLPGNERYYDVVIGKVHFFFLSDDDLEPDGNTSSSVQGNWLQAKLALSAAAWKIVVLNRSPFASQGGVVGLQWPFATWGASMVLSGDLGQYERLTVDAIPYILNGLGGRTILPVSGGADSHSEFRNADGFGAGRIIATTCSLRYELVNLAGEIVDSIQINKADCSETTTTDTVVGPAAAVLPLYSSDPTIRQVHSWAGDPNGHVYSVSPAITIDTTNGVIWQKNDGISSSNGWH